MRMDATYTLFVVSMMAFAIVHLLAVQSYLYWVYTWFDIPMHFLGGVVVALGYLSWIGRRFIAERHHTFLKTLAFVLVVGLAWEVYEWYFNVAHVVAVGGYIEDTVTDLFLDLVGGACAYMIAATFRRMGM